MFEAWEALNSLPTVSASNCELTWYERHNTKTHDMFHVIGGTQRFSPDQKLTDFTISQQDLLSSWEHLNTMRAGFKKLQLVAYDDQLQKILDVLEKVHRLKRSVDKKEITLHEVTDELGSNFIENESVALFVRRMDGKTVTEGYLGAKGDIVPLGRARMFDSEDAVQAFLNRTNTNYYFSSLQMVKVNLQITELGQVFAGKAAAVDGGQGIIAEAIARVQKEKIHQALQQASRDKLLERLKELDQEEAPSPVVPKPRKM